MGKKIEPTEAMVGGVELGRKLMSMDVRTILRAALNHPDAPGLFESEWKANAEAAAERAERAEYLLADAVHVDEAARRVEAAREQALDEGWNEGWNGAANALGRIGFRHLTPTIRDANPYRPAQPLPTKKGAVIAPADGHEYIESTVHGRTWRTVQAVQDSAGYWVGAWRSGADVIAHVAPKEIAPGTWKVADE